MLFRSRLRGPPGLRRVPPGARLPRDRRPRQLIGPDDFAGPRSASQHRPANPRYGLLTAAGRIHSPPPPPPHVRIQGADPFSHDKTGPQRAGIQACWPTTNKAAADSSNQRRRSVPIATRIVLSYLMLWPQTIKLTSSATWRRPLAWRRAPRPAGTCCGFYTGPAIAACFGIWCSLSWTSGQRTGYLWLRPAGTGCPANNRPCAVLMESEASWWNRAHRAGYVIDPDSRPPLPWRP